MNENVKEYCKRWNGKVNVIEREFDLPSGQYTQMYADMITGHTIPKKVLMMEPDMVWDKEQLKKALQLPVSSILVSIGMSSAVKVGNTSLKWSWILLTAWYAVLSCIVECKDLKTFVI